MKLFYAFYKAFILSPVLASISHENTKEIPLTSKKKKPPGKILLGRCVELGTSFHGRNKFFSRFFFNIPEIPTQI